jgi:hypothetical protein
MAKKPANKRQAKALTEQKADRAHHTRAWNRRMRHGDEKHEHDWVRHRDVPRHVLRACGGKTRFDRTLTLLDSVYLEYVVQEAGLPEI